MAIESDFLKFQFQLYLFRIVAATSCNHIQMGQSDYNEVTYQRKTGRAKHLNESLRVLVVKRRACHSQGSDSQPD